MSKVKLTSGLVNWLFRVEGYRMAYGIKWYNNIHVEEEYVWGTDGTRLFVAGDIENVPEDHVKGIGKLVHAYSGKFWSIPDEVSELISFIGSKEITECIVHIHKKDIVIYNNKVSYEVSYRNDVKVMSPFSAKRVLVNAHLLSSILDGLGDVRIAFHEKMILVRGHIDSVPCFGIVMQLKHDE